MSCAANARAMPPTPSAPSSGPIATPVTSSAKTARDRDHDDAEESALGDLDLVDREPEEEVIPSPCADHGGSTPAARPGRS